MEEDNPNQSVNSTETTLQPVQHPVNNQRGNFPIILGVLVLLLIVGGGAYYFGKTSNKPVNTNEQLQSVVEPSLTTSSNNQVTQFTADKTINLNTYTNNKYGYSLSYKLNPIFKQRNCGSDPFDFNGEEWFILLTSNPTYQYKTCYPPEGLAALQIVVESGDKTSEKSIFAQFPKPDWNLSIQEISIGNKNGKMIYAEFVGEDESGIIQSPIKEVRVFNKGYTYFIDLTDFEYEETYNQIISTFKFTN